MGLGIIVWINIEIEGEGEMGQEMIILSHFEFCFY